MYLVNGFHLSMFRDIVLSALTTLIPTWSKSLTEHYKLPSEYYVVANMLLTDIVRRICGVLNETVVIGIIIIAGIWFIQKQYVSWNEIRFKISRMWKKSILRMTTQDPLIVNAISKIIEDNPDWIINKGETIQYTTEVTITATGKCRYYPFGYMCIKHPKHEIEIECLIGTNDKSKLTFVAMNLYEGTPEKFQKFITESILSFNSCGQDLLKMGQDYVIGDYVCVSYLDSIDNFFHHDRDHLIKTLEWANKNSATTALGMLLYGPPGTGKTSFAQRVAKHLRRIPYVINLKTITKRRDLFRTLLNPSLTNEGLVTKDVLFIIDEFDKGLRNLNAMQALYQKRQMAFGNFVEQADAGVDKITSNMKLLNGDDESKRINELMTVDDFLSIISGPIHIPGLIVMAMTNDYEYIKEECPALVRPGRFTPVLFDNGDKKLYGEIVKHYTQIEFKGWNKLPADFRFQQSRVIEQINVMKTYMSLPDIHKKLTKEWETYKVVPVVSKPVVKKVVAKPASPVRPTRPIVLKKRRDESEDEDDDDDSEYEEHEDGCDCDECMEYYNEMLNVEEEEEQLKR